MSAKPVNMTPVHGQPFVTHPALRMFPTPCSSHPLTKLADLRDARDAHIVFEAVRLNILPLITRRLTTVEREQLVSGNVFVWEEAEHKQGTTPSPHLGFG